MNKKLHVLIIPSWYPSFKEDYVGSFFREQAIALSKENCRVGILFPELLSLRKLKNIKIFPSYSIYNDNGVNTFKLKWSNWFIKSKYLQIKAFKFIGHLLFKKYLSKFGKPDLIHCQSIFNASFLGEYLSTKYEIPFIIIEHNSGFYYKTQGFQKYYNSAIRISSKAKKCFSVSSSYSKYLNKELKNNLEWGVHHNIVSDFFFKTRIQTPNTEKFIFLTINRLHKIKNVDLLIKSFHLFNEIYPFSELRIVGVGYEYKQLKRLSRSLGIDKKVKFLGRLNRSEIPKQINQSHVYVHSSIYETFGVVFVESLAMGRPVISTNVGGVNEIVDETVGIIINDSNPDEFFQAMKNIKENYETFNPIKIREYCKKRFSEEFLTKKLISHYADVLGHNNYT